MGQSARLPWAVCLLFALILGVTSSPLLNERASQSCNARDVQIVKRTAIDPVYFCKWWISDIRTRSPFLEFGHERVTAACKCIAPTKTKTKRTEDTEEQQGLAKRQTTESCRREVATQFTEPWHFCNFYNAYPRKSSPFKRYAAQQLLKLCNCVQGKSVTSSTKKTTSSVKTTSKKTSVTVKSSSTSTKKISSTFSKAISSSKLSSSSQSRITSTTKPSSTSTKKTSSSSSKTISSTKISSSSKLPATSSKSTTSSNVKSSSTSRKTSSSRSSTLPRSSASSSAIPQVITITQIITVTEGPKSSLSTATSTLVTTIPVVSSSALASSSVTTSETSSISESASVAASETLSSSADASTSTTGPSTSETSSSTSDVPSTTSETSSSTPETSSSSTDVSSSETSSSTEPITSGTPSPSIDPVSAAQDIIVTSSYQPFCSGLLDYSDETSTVSSTTTEVSTTTVTVTTTDLTAVTQMYKRKRDIAPITTECGHDHRLKRQAPTPTPTETSASSSDISSSDISSSGDSVQFNILTPAALQTFSASVLSSACSAEITTTATTVTEVTTESTVSTETSTKTISSTTTISIASSAPTGVIGYLEIRPVINAGAQYVRSDVATHMTDNGNDPSGRETFIITTDNKLYSVTNDAYYYTNSVSGGDLLYWSHSASQGLSSFTSGPTDASGYSQLLFQDKRTAPTGVYYKFCLASDYGGSTGSHMYFYGADADLSNQRCKLVEIYFAPTS
ncbi:hypothetical protein KCU86_g5543, partial [Aureobasidium melanogenum]